jgi:phage shock protein C
MNWHHHTDQQGARTPPPPPPPPHEGAGGQGEWMTRSPNPHKFRRDKQHAMLGGVCAGIAEYFGLAPWQIRLIMILLIIFGVFAPYIILAYLILWAIIPRKEAVREPIAPQEEAFWREVSLKPTVTLSRLRYTFRDLDRRMADMEREVTSENFRLRRAFQEIEQ